jgi:putative intracellular protease/amidase
MLIWSPEQLPPLDTSSLAGRKVLFLVPAYGGVPQETLNPVAFLEQLGISVQFASVAGGSVSFDPLCRVLAWLEWLWSPTLGLLRQFERGRRLEQLVSLRDLEQGGKLAEWLLSFDAVLVPGGHGQGLANFLNDPTIVNTVSLMAEAGKVVGIECHSVILATRVVDASGQSLTDRFECVCWPAALERPLSWLPFLGRYLSPLGRPVEHLVRAAGGKVHRAFWPWNMPHAVIHGLLVTSWGPWSTRAFAAAVALRLGAVSVAA